MEDIKDLADGQYGIPLCCDNLTPCSLVDAVIQPDILIKFTVLDCHGKLSDEEKYQALRDQLRGAMDTHKLIFVVKPEQMMSTDFQPLGIPADLHSFKMTY